MRCQPLGRKGTAGPPVPGATGGSGRLRFFSAAGIPGDHLALRPTNVSGIRSCDSTRARPVQRALVGVIRDRQVDHEPVTALPAVRIGRRVRIKRADFNQFLTTAAGPAPPAPSALVYTADQFRDANPIRRPRSARRRPPRPATKKATPVAPGHGAGPPPNCGVLRPPGVGESGPRPAEATYPWEGQMATTDVQPQVRMIALEQIRHDANVRELAPSNPGAELDPAGCVRPAVREQRVRRKASVREEALRIQKQKCGRPANALPTWLLLREKESSSAPLGLATGLGRDPARAEFRFRPWKGICRSRLRGCSDRLGGRDG
jgi:hypothetical protein